MKVLAKFSVLIVVLALLTALSIGVCAQPATAESAAAETAQTAAAEDSSGMKAVASAVAVGLAAAGAAIGMGLAIAKSADGIARQPEAEGKIRTALMLGLVFVETVVIYALIIAILIIFVL